MFEPGNSIKHLPLNTDSFHDQVESIMSIRLIETHTKIISKCLEIGIIKHNDLNYFKDISELYTGQQHQKVLISF